MQATVAQLVQAAEAFDLPRILAVYADDFVSGTGRSKEAVAAILSQLQANRVSLRVEHTELEKVTPTTATLRTRIRLRYADWFHTLGEGEVVITDVLLHWLRKEAQGWRIYTDRRIASYRDGRFGPQPPNVELVVPETLPLDPVYPVHITVRRETGRTYRVMVGNYTEDPGILPPPDISAVLPPDGGLTATLIPNPRRLSEIVRVTVIAADTSGQWVGAATLSKLVPGAQPSPERTA
ncbi:MAG: nuclear transport factor 2 family protein [Candidatus Binatia bacterium]|nr:nuclear transport factor 2 family protein [Candidatus Binatia bacterium]